MDKKRFIWYKNEIERLKEIDKNITNKVRASYTISEPKEPNSSKLKKGLEILFKDQDNA
tara:strand:+ start:185 stop:361 length:177 start_codon:yes stop_codon:yes gene_type:complete